MSSFHLSRRTQDRLAALFPLAAVALFAALSFWLDARVAASMRPVKASPSAPEHFMEGFRVERSVPLERGRDTLGAVQDTLAGVRADHFPSALRTVVREPSFRSDVPGKPRLEVSSRTATIISEQPRGDVERIEFAGGVTMTQAATAARDAVRFETEAITVVPATQEAMTDRPTRTVSGDRVVVTQGLHLDRELRTGKTSRGFQLELNPKDLTTGSKP